jgi:ribosome-binding protein aMBF1 (putative translation factor)
MTAKTCAACDCPLDGSAIKVKLGQSTVEVCCDECARALREADASRGANPREATARQGRS